MHVWPCHFLLRTSQGLPDSLAQPFLLACRPPESFCSPLRFCPAPLAPQVYAHGWEQGLGCSSQDHAPWVCSCPDSWETLPKSSSRFRSHLWQEPGMLQAPALHLSLGLPPPPPLPVLPTVLHPWDGCRLAASSRPLGSSPPCQAPEGGALSLPSTCLHGEGAHYPCGGTDVLRRVLTFSEYLPSHL